MKKNSLPTIGFDRFIDFSWAEYTLDLAVAGGEAKQLRSWLSSQIDGEVSARKTFNVLHNLWLNSYPETRKIREKALTLASILNPSHRLVLHWGMALANFELFQHTAAIMGKLLRLQGNFHKSGVQQRVAEAYSNQGTIPRAVSRIVQSLRSWNVIQESGSNSFICSEKYPVRDEKLVAWLLRAALNRQKDKPISTSEIIRLPELFPFEIPENAQNILRSDSDFTIIREGLNLEYVILS
jgi:hypothetical protein